MVKRWQKAPFARRSGVLMLLVLGAVAACSAGDDSDADTQSQVRADGVEVTNVTITPGNGVATARFTVKTSHSLHFNQIVLAVRNAQEEMFDFARQTDVTFNGTRTFEGASGALANGDYSAWIAYTLDGSNWRSASSPITFTVGGPGKGDAGTGTDSGSGTDAGTPPGDSGTTPPPPPPAGKTLVFDAPFNDTSNWTVGRSSSYPGATNPGDNKLDYISASNAPDADGTFRAIKRSDGKWDADLVTTEYSQKKFELKPGDELDATVTLGPELGAWPAIWTWGKDLSSGVQPGHGEVDLFEYHPDNVDLLELSNHVSDGHLDYRNSNNVKPGKPFDLKVIFGRSSVDWYINGASIFKDGKGVPANWTAYPIVNISVCAGQYHPAPPSSLSSMSYKVTNFRVYR
ncbi:hypothetical protein LZC95_50595 [Pendulispora brunnea]|uniref:GH16 domain-containing protein n=1 Tax=Pendulispora brunnea TaxID=2905690 RepID=A0ABZ2KE55_9BACT